MRRGRLLIAIGLAGVFAGCPAMAFAALPSDYYGINAQAVWRLPTSQQPAQLNAIHTAGIRLVRFDIPWNWVEPNPPVNGVHSYQWQTGSGMFNATNPFSTPDTTVSELAQAGLEPYPILDDIPSWATHPPVTCGCSEISAYGDFAQAVAKRYGPGGSFWTQNPTPDPVKSYELFNEPNISTNDQIPAQELAVLYSQASQEIKQFQPQANVVSGGLSSTASGDTSIYLNQFLSYMELTHAPLDALGYHTYDGSAAADLSDLAGVRSLLNMYGFSGSPIELTEAGFGRSTDTASDEQWKAGEITTLADCAPVSSSNVSRLIIHTWIDDPNQVTGPFYGIANADGSLKASGQAYANAIAQPGPCP